MWNMLNVWLVEQLGMLFTYLGQQSQESIKSSAKLLVSIEAILNYLMGSSQWDIRLLPVQYASLNQQPQGPIFEA